MSDSNESPIPAFDPAAGSAPVVFIDSLSRPYLAFRGWLHFRSGNNEWITLRQLKPGEYENVSAMKLPDDQAALYGWPCGVPNDKDIPTTAEYSSPAHENRQGEGAIDR